LKVPLLVAVRQWELQVERNHVSVAMLQALYDLAVAQGSGSGDALAAMLPQELYVEGFDAEQIWLQLEAQSGGALKRARRLLKKAGEEPQLMLPEMEEALDGESSVAYGGVGWPLNCQQRGAVKRGVNSVLQSGG
jgi:hypothetical protein